MMDYMTSSEITIVREEDWTGIYVDGNLVIQGEYLDPFDVIYSVMNIAPKVSYSGLDFISTNKNLPENLEDLEIDG